MMQITDADCARLVVAAQGGDAQAREELVAVHLPLLYNVVGRALNGHPDADDVVQETLLRVVRDLRGLRSPESFRSWLIAIAMHQVSAYWRRRRDAEAAAAPIQEADDLPDAGVLEDYAVLRHQVSGQRRQVLDATGWLDPDARTLLSLWWQENAGWLTRAEVAAASGLTAAHTGVRLQRMRDQLETARAVVAALEARPRCGALQAAIAGWDGLRAPVWRKRIARHIRGCDRCGQSAAGQLPTEQLLLGVAPLAVPAPLVAALVARGLLHAFPDGPPGLVPPGSAAGRAGRGLGRPASRVLHTMGAHPLASIAAGLVITGGVAAYAVHPPAGPAHMPPPSAAAAALGAPMVAAPPVTARPSPSVPAGSVPLGSWSLESVAEPGLYVSSPGLYAALTQVSAASASEARQQATFTVVPGLADPRCVSFVASDGDYLRHWELRLRFSPIDSPGVFRADATFCPRPGAVPGSVTLQSVNYPDRVLRFRDGGIYIDLVEDTQSFARESSFFVRASLAS